MCVHTCHWIVCTNCRKLAEEFGETKREALELAKEEGFVRKRVPNGSMWDFCPTCYEKYLAEEDDD